MKKRFSIQEIETIYKGPLLQLIFKATEVHCKNHEPGEIQVCSLVSLKTGGCSEDCEYCSQSSRYETGVQKETMMEPETVLDSARKAKEAGSTRFCMGMAGKKINDTSGFETILEMVREVNDLGMEVCCSLGQINYDQARKLKEAGLHTYNHNLDTSEKHYPNIVTTHTYQDRLKTIKNISKADLTLCCGGILGLGETEADRIDLMATLANMVAPPESVPVNVLVPIPGTPLENQPKVSIWEVIRVIATLRILLPSAIVRLSAGRIKMTKEEQALCLA